jgi:SAM-dependent methyltransferase
MTDQVWAQPQDLHANQPHSARMYDYYLGGKDNFAADRAAAEQALTVAPELRELARENRKFLQRAVRFVASAGIRQFLDIGTGIPTQGNTHEIAQSITPDARVVYVDSDPIVLVHARALLTGTEEGKTVVVQSDACESEAILGNSDLQQTLDFSKPVALMFVSVLQFIADERDPAGGVARLKEVLAPGSYLILSHPTGDFRSAAVTQVAQTYNNAKVSAVARSGEQIAGFFDGFELVEPGLVQLPLWRPDTPVVGELDQMWMYGGVGYKEN